MMRKTPKEIFKKLAAEFMDNPPYKESPYSGRGWGSPWHSLCSFSGKMKPAIAHFLISRFTEPSDTVLDPFCGVGTIPFEACLQGRTGIGNDLSAPGYVVTKAKLTRPRHDGALEVIEALRAFTRENLNTPTIDALRERYADFGYNGKLPDYFHPDTFLEILCTREFFVERLPRLTSEEALVYSAFLHVLHGNRPYALSRKSHPLTPYAPSGEFIYKNAAEHIEKKVRAALRNSDFPGYTAGKAMFGDFRDICICDGSADAVICSPPFAGSIRFHMYNWMRFWLCGWEKEDFGNNGSKFLNIKKANDFSEYGQFFRLCHKALRPYGKIILHLGRKEELDMAEGLMRYAEPYFEEVFRGSESVADIEKHGITDKGGTIEHQFLFLIRR